MPRSRLAWWGGALLIAALAAALVLYGLSARSSKPGTDYQRFAHGALAKLVVERQPPPQPAQTLYDADGHTSRLRDYRSGVVLVNYWATWCAPCVAELPTLAALQRNYRGRIRVIAISIDGEEGNARAQAELARLSDGGLTFYEEPTRGIIFDEHGDLPTTILFDRHGQERARLTGGANWAGADAAAFVDAALADR